MEKERYNELKDKRIIVAKAKDNSYLNALELRNASLNVVYKYLRDNREKIGLKRIYYKREIALEFEYSNNDIKKSLMLTSAMHVNVQEYLDVISCLDEIIENAVLLEVHQDKTGKATGRLKNVYVFISAYEKNNQITPVQLEIKENIEIENHLYLVVAIKKSGVIETKSTKVASASIPDNSIISIHDLIQKINPDAIDFLKYIPNQFLTIEQLVGKKQGILKDITKYPNSPFKNVSTT